MRSNSPQARQGHAPTYRGALAGRKRIPGSDLAQSATRTSASEEENSMGFIFSSRKIHTHASMKGFESHSFHQNSRLTRLQSGSVENGSTRGSTFKSGYSTEGSGGKALSSARKFSSVRDFRNWSCLFCKDLVISVQSFISS